MKSSKLTLFFPLCRLDLRLHLDLGRLPTSRLLPVHSHSNRLHRLQHHPFRLLHRSLPLLRPRFTCQLELLLPSSAPRPRNLPRSLDATSSTPIRSIVSPLAARQDRGSQHRRDSSDVRVITGIYRRSRRSSRFGSHSIGCVCPGRFSWLDVRFRSPRGQGSHRRLDRGRVAQCLSAVAGRDGWSFGSCEDIDSRCW